MENQQFRWTPNRIHSLRLRLGWSKSDLARRLECSAQDINEWETSTAEPKGEYLGLLEFIEKQAEHLSLEVHVCPLAERALEGEHLSQIEIDNLI